MGNDQVQAVEAGVNAEEEVAIVRQIIDGHVGNLREVPLSLRLHFEIPVHEKKTSV